MGGDLWAELTEILSLTKTQICANTTFIPYKTLFFAQKGLRYIK